MRLLIPNGVFARYASACACVYFGTTEAGENGDKTTKRPNYYSALIAGDY
jgi:hypothetical protein